MIHKAITLHQPWAELLVLGIKEMETRSWPINKLLGNMDIHASKRPMCDVGKALAAKYNINNLVYGAIIGNVFFASCFQIDEGWVQWAQKCSEYELGEWREGRFGWHALAATKLKEPIYCRGYQRIWNFDPNKKTL